MNIVTPVHKKPAANRSHFRHARTRLAVFAGQVYTRRHQILEGLSINFKSYYGLERPPNNGRRNAVDASMFTRSWRPYPSIPLLRTATTHPNSHDRRRRRRRRRNAMVPAFSSPAITTTTSHGFHPEAERPLMNSSLTNRAPEPATPTINRPESQQSGMGNCVICLKDLGNGRALVWCESQCQQVYHFKCMAKLLQRAATCPLWYETF